MVEILGISLQECMMECTIRTFSDKIYHRIRQKILDLLDGLKNPMVSKPNSMKVSIIHQL